jgi:hypothetical protein
MRFYLYKENLVPGKKLEVERKNLEKQKSQKNEFKILYIIHLSRNLKY